MNVTLTKTHVVLASIMVLAQLALAEVTLSGAGSMARVLTPKQAQIEATSGQTIKIVSKNTGLGIKDLLAGKAQLAMATGPLAAGCKALEISDADAASFHASVIGHETVAFIVHPSNTVASLTPAQLKDIFTGKIANWKEVGGTDLAIKVYAVEKTNGFRLAVDEKLLAGAALTSTAEERSKSADVIPAVSQQPAAISFVALSDVKPSVKVVEEGAIAYDLQLVSKGEPTKEEQAVIEAAKKALETK